MSSPRSTPKQRKGIRRLLEPFNRSQSRSPSQTLPQPTHDASPAATASNEPEISPSPITDNNATAANPASGSTIDDVASISATLETQATTTSGYLEPETLMYLERIAALNPSNSRPTSPKMNSEQSNTPSEAPLSTDRGDVELKADLPTVTSSTQWKRSQNAAWGGLQVALELLRDAFPPFSSVVSSVLSCLDGLEVVVKTRQDYEDLAIELTTLVKSLKELMDESSLAMTTDSAEGLAIDIEQQVAEIRERLDHAPTRGIRDALADEEELVRHYRRIQSHFRRLQTSVVMSIRSTVNEQSANTRIESLNPAQEAFYDSNLSTKINRRGCTEGTRIGVLNDLNNWLHDPGSSSIYWLNGMAGTGKTTIAATFCERVERRKILAASFFCTRSSAECMDVTRIVPTIAYELARYSIPFRSALCNILEQDPDIGAKNILKQFEKLLKEPLQKAKDSMPENLVIVIDALDECENQNGVELVLDMLFRHAAQVPVKFLVTSRPEPEIFIKMAAHANAREVLRLHEIEQSLVQADIELYLKEELDFASPTTAEIEQLAQRSGALFIYAATLVRYISGKHSADHSRRLKAVLDMKHESTRRHTQIDALYTTVLESALNDDELEAEEVEDIQLVLRIVLLSQEPIGVKTIADLTGIGDQRRVEYALPYLRSVLHQSESDARLVSTLHASFPDFMFNEQRSGPYFCDAGKYSELVSRSCFLAMKEQLRFNICDLHSSFLPDKEVENLKDRISDKISPTLSYTCRYWANHLKLVRASKPDALLAAIDEFMSHSLLFWMEVLCLQRELLMGVEGLLKAQQWLVDRVSPSHDLVLFIDDARNFITGFAVNPVSQSTPHIYLSSLAFCPQSNLVYKHYRKRAQGLLELKGSLMDRREAAPLAIWNTSSEIQSLAMSPDGTRVAIGCLDTTISILSAYNGTVNVGPLQGHTSSVNAVTFSPDGARLASASLGGVRVWNAYNGTQLAGPFKGHMRFINSVSFSPDGTRIVSCAHDSTIRIWNAADGKPLIGPLTHHSDLVLRVSFSPSGTLIASGSADRTIRLWKASDGTPAAPPLEGHNGWVDSLTFTPDGAHLVSGSGDKTIRVWKVDDGSLVTTSFEGYSEGINELAISPDGKRIAVACHDRAVRVWRIDDGKLVAGPFYGHTDSVKSVVYSPDGTRVISGSSDKSIRVWNVRDGMLPPPPLPPLDAVMALRSITFCPDNIHFLSSDVYEAIQIWDSSDGSFITAPEQAKFFPTPLSILSPDGSCIASTKDGKIQITSTTNAALIMGPFDVERGSLSTFSFSHNSKAIIMGCQDGTIKVCDLQSEKHVLGSFRAHPRGVSSLTESPSCSLLVSYSDYENVLRIWDIVTPALEIELRTDVSTGTMKDNYAAVHDEWSIKEDGWVVNNSQHLLFWLPPAVASAWCSPYAKLVITRSGILQVPKQTPFIGDQWTRCYVS
ncbi:Vegetative incompatibility protein HET-E-1 OS=Podospora anserina GN=HET-E1 PE=4 SV=1 [Rhizoctonia solani AG-1 IB]|uniref:Vegetative incompatibility protein HET-E-1 n=1 Tax=Thanatephorus cucumeris (strain AG1-IB / isolate 7/3/14) TaxID=1108050 RepID=A0A0B7FGP5_THACB|nr:Vegetative incompatibility protein HET-E-1 OS=Podospora anserina GN=HET-E1 PE=4 SV=1 [Rhizoctonia solani AG-1 IB]